MPYDVPALPYDYGALEPHIDDATMRVHHDKHHQAYVDKANAALEGTEWADKPVEEVLKNLDSLPSDKQTPVRNNGGGHLNHDIFWNCLAPAAGQSPGGALGDALQRRFGSFDNFRKRFSETAAKQFSNGWTALSFEHVTRQLDIVSLKDHEVLKPGERTCVLILDVWEHAYYLKYQNRRPEFIEAFWNVVNWAHAQDLYDHASAAPTRSRAVG